MDKTEACERDRRRSLEIEEPTEQNKSLQAPEQPVIMEMSAEGSAGIFSECALQRTFLTGESP